MPQQPNETDVLAQKKRDAARRARRLANGLIPTADQDRLKQLADELDKEAASLERLAHSVSLPPVVAPQQQVHDQMQQQQSAETPAQPQQPNGR